ncbi:MAG: hypothetical protein F4Y38_00485 [Gemmatimonadetes bacterium]|nr:hypothetical protein [Gemmatimonadota bacterium]MYG85514.1 hypothetical protein [Gemmatimonadota bacterium]MYJ91159.1 hypothetical protein [Gemmatimonadota bacterium]
MPAHAPEHTTDTSQQASIPVIRLEMPRLFRPADDPGFRYEAPADPVRRRILSNLLDDCELFAGQRPWRRVPRRAHSPHPNHQLYLTFYTAMQATALIENYAFTWRLTGDPRWLGQARAWLRAAANWDHGDHVEEHFYTVNRYMQAFALALDLMDEVLPDVEKRQVRDCLVGLMDRWWPYVDERRHYTAGGHHTVVDYGHFGVAAVHLLGEHPRAEAWVQAVVDRFRGALLPNGCGPGGEPIDGPTFWGFENLWLLHFADAMRNVTGVDLLSEAPARLRLPLNWFRAHWTAPRDIPDMVYYPPNANVLLGGQLNVNSPVLLRLAQEAGDGRLRDVALSDPRLGRLYRFGMSVRGTTAECMISYGPYAYCYYDPAFRPNRARRVTTLAGRFDMYTGRFAVMRSSHDPEAAILCVSGYDGGLAACFMDLHVQWAGSPLLRTISAFEAQPVRCGSLPGVGGQNENVANLGGLKRTKDWQRLRVSSRRTEHEYWISRGDDPVLLVALRRRPRGVRVVADGSSLIRLRGGDVLQYEAERWFRANGGRLRIRFRLRGRASAHENASGLENASGPRVLFNAGNGVGGHFGTGVNTFALVVDTDGRLCFSVQSQNSNLVTVHAPGTAGVGTWHEAQIAWDGFNRRGANPWMEIALDGKSNRLDDPAVFGELGRDSQGLASRKEPRTFYARPNTALAFGGSIQTPGVTADCDLSLIDLRCPGRRRLTVDPAVGLGPETGGGELSYKLNPVELLGLEGDRARLGAGSREVELISVLGSGLTIRKEEVPYAPPGLAAGSLVSFLPDATEPSTRLVAGTDGDILVLAFSDSSSKARISQVDDRFRLSAGGRAYAFEVSRGRGGILRPI